MKSKTGINSLAAIILLLIEVGQQTYDIAEDKKVSLAELATLFPTILKLPNAFKNMGEAVEQVKNLTREQSAELHEIVKDNFEIPDENLEEIVELAVEALLTNFAIGKEMSSLIKERKAKKVNI